MIVAALGSYSNNIAGLLNVPPKVSVTLPVEVAASFSVTWLLLSTLAMDVFGNPAPFADHPTCRPAVVAGDANVTVKEPAVAVPVSVIGFGPASATRITCPLGRIAAGHHPSQNLRC